MRLLNLFKKSVIFILCISVLFPLALFFSSATELTDNIFTYKVTNGIAEITSINNRYKSKATIPEAVEKYPVKSIAAGAFYGNESLVEIEFSEGIETVGELAFYFCSKLEKVTFSKSLTTIGDDAFARCSQLREILIPSNVKTIGNSAFSICTKITVEEDNKNFSSDEHGVLFNKAKTILLQYPTSSPATEYDVPSTVKKIESKAFRRSEHLEKLKLPKGLTSIGEEAFAQSAIASVELPRGLKTLEKSAFSLAPVITVNIPDSITEIPEKLFYLCTSLEKVTVSDKVTTIGESAFFGCSKLSKFDMPSGASVIGNGAFFGCKSLTDITIPNGTVRIGDNTFYNCGLTTITLPGSLKSIGYEAFFSCNELSRINFNGSKELWSEVFIDSNNDWLLNAETVYKDYNINFKIKTPESKSVKYGETLVLYIESDKIPEGSRIVWTASGKCAEIRQSIDGTACHVVPLKSGEVRVTATLLDESSDIAVNSENKKLISTVKIKTKMSFFQKAVSYVKNLFGVTRYVF